MSPAHSLTAQERIALAVERSGKTLEQLAREVGCTHAALSQWRSGRTDVSNIKAGLLHAFADSTGIDPRWLLTGAGPMVSRYTLNSELQRIAAALQQVARNQPQQVETIVRMVEAAAGKPFQ